MGLSSALPPHDREDGSTGKKDKSENTARETPTTSVDTYDVMGKRLVPSRERKSRRSTTSRRGTDPCSTSFPASAGRWKGKHVPTDLRAVSTLQPKDEPQVPCANEPDVRAGAIGTDFYGDNSSHSPRSFAGLHQDYPGSSVRGGYRMYRKKTKRITAGGNLRKQHLYTHPTTHWSIACGRVLLMCEGEFVETDSVLVGWVLSYVRKTQQRVQLRHASRACRAPRDVDRYSLVANYERRGRVARLSCCEGCCSLQRAPRDGLLQNQHDQPAWFMRRRAVGMNFLLSVDDHATANVSYNSMRTHLGYPAIC